MYELRSPDPYLAAWVENYWFVTGTAADPVDVRVDVFVDGRPDLVFLFGGPWEREVIGGDTVQVPNSRLDAQRRQPIRIRQSGAVHTVGVRFRLGGLAPFARVALADVTDQLVAPDLVLGSEARTLERALAMAPGVDARAALLDAFFRSQYKPVPAAFDAALDHLVQSDGGATVADAADTAGVSVRQVERLFARHLGLTPKMTARVLRFQVALRALMTDPGVTLAEVASAAGYFDQAHFVRDFRRMTGGVPRGYRGYYPPKAPNDFAPNVVVFVQDPDGSTP